jgi:hypothetical protein
VTLNRGLEPIEARLTRQVKRLADALLCAHGEEARKVDAAFQMQALAVRVWAQTLAALRDLK